MTVCLTHDRTKSLKDICVTILLPVYNEEKVLNRLLQELLEIVTPAQYTYEIIFVDDGSTDNTPDILNRFAESDKHIRVIHLSRNFGQQAALQAGIENSSGDVIVIMDADLQDNAAAIPLFIEKWQEGYDVVYSIRVSRQENIIKKSLFYSFYRILRFISNTDIPADAGNFGLIDRSVANEINMLDDHDRYYPGLRSWVGFNQTGIEVARGERYDGKPRVNFYRLWLLAKSAIFSFSSFPLTLFYLIAFICIIAFLSTAGFTLYHKFYTKLAIPGWTSTLIAISFFGALNALGVGVMGEYLMRIYDQVRNRPLYIIKNKVNFSD